MAKQRLSKLQKWILTKCYKTDGFVLPRWYVVKEFFGEKTPATESSTSRSIWTLIDRGYLNGFSPADLGLMAFAYGAHGKTKEEFKKDFKEVLKEPPRQQKVPILTMPGLNKVKLISLTEKGKKKAKELLKVK